MKLERINPASREAWLALRTADVTSTEVSALFGCNPFKRAYKLWHEKFDPGSVEPLQENDRMKWGLRLEEAAAHGIAKDEGFKIRRFPFYCRDADARLGASYDYEVLDGMDAVLEVKNVAVDQRHKWDLTPGREEAPPYIELQLQQQMMLAGKSRGIIGALIGGNEVVVIRREPDTELHEAIRRAAATFWATVEAGREPTPDWVLDADDVIARYQKIDEDLPPFEARNNPVMDELIQAYEEARDRESEAKKEKRAAQAQILTLIGEAKKAIGDDWSLSAGTVSKQEYTVKATSYRDFRVSRKKVKA